MILHYSLLPLREKVAGGRMRGNGAPHLSLRDFLSQRGEEDNEGAFRGVMRYFRQQRAIHNPSPPPLILRGGD